MKMEGVVTAAVTPVMQKVKVKEEARECCGSLLSLSCSCTCTCTCTCACTCTTAAPALTTATIICNTPTTTPTTTPTPIPTSTPPTMNNNPEPSPANLNLNLKPRNKVPAQPNQPANERTAEDKKRERDSPLGAEGSEQRRSPSSQSQVMLLQRPSALPCDISRPAPPQDGRNICNSRSSDSDSDPLVLPLVQRSNAENGDCNNKPKASACSQEELDAVDRKNGSRGREVSGAPGEHAKLKRLLGTLVQFAIDISPETGDTVRALVLSLLSGGMSAEEFHSALQEATNFPLRGFVLPYLKHTLPSLQRDLNNAARTNNQTSVQYLRLNEAAVFEADAPGFNLSGDAAEVFGERNNSCSSLYYPYANTYSNANTNTNTTLGHGSTQHANSSLHHYPGPSHALKRRASDTPYYENGAGTLFEDGPLYGKRSMNPWTVGSSAVHHHHQQQADSATYCWYHPVQLQSHPNAHPQTTMTPITPMPPSLVQINHLASSSIASASHLVNQPQPAIAMGHGSQMQNGSDDEWKNIHVMLNCILSMVEKTKRALAILQRRGCLSPAAPLAANSNSNNNNNINNNSNNNNNNNPSNGSQADMTNNDRDNSLKRISGEIVAQTIRATEDRVAEVKRRAEEAVQEVKRAAVAEVQRAVAAAAAESRAAERFRVQRLFEIPLPQKDHGVPQRETPIRTTTNTTTTATTTTATTTAATTATSAGAGGRDDDKEIHPVTGTGSSCWNCGRPALETCGGCGVARYCGPFCQHRDWEAGGHHATCNHPPRRTTSPSGVPLQSPTTSTAATASAAAVMSHPNRGK